MIQNLVEFKRELNKFVEDSARKQLKFHVGIANQLKNFVTEGMGQGTPAPGTPIDTSFAINNWQMSTNPQCPTDTVGSYPGKDVKLVTKPVKNMPLSAAKVGGMIWVYNNTKYIEALEDGHSKKQAPRGFVEGAMAALEQYIKDYKGI